MKVLRGSSGAALVETVLLIVLLFVPMVVMLGALARVHQAALGVTTAAREAGSAAVAAAGQADGLVRATEAVATVMKDHTLAPSNANLEVRGLGSFGRGATVNVRVAYPVRVLDVPFVGGDVGPAVWVRASHTAYVDKYRSTP